MQSYRHLVRFLKQKLPDMTISVRRVRTKENDWGDCDFVDGVFLITINRRLDEIASIVILLHEVAHALSWHTDKHPSDHGPSFGLAYARVWRLYLQWIKS